MPDTERLLSNQTTAREIGLQNKGYDPAYGARPRSKGSCRKNFKTPSLNAGQLAKSSMGKRQRIG